MKGLFFNDIHNAYLPEILGEIYRQRVYEQFLGDRKDLTILDIGGNAGLTTFYFYDFAKKVITVEPSQQHIEEINQMVEFNQMGDKVIVVQKALGTTNGTADFYHNENVTMFSMRPEVNSRPEDKETVETITLDKLLTQTNTDHVDFMKLDIEGSEVEVVASKGFEEGIKKVDSMLVEYHRWSGRNPSQLTTALMDYGFKVFPIPSDAILFGAKR